MAFDIKSFTVGKNDFPIWFKEKCDLGIARVNMEDGELINVQVNKPGKTEFANIGDTIMLTKSGLAVIPHDKAVKYNIQKESKVKTEEDNQEV